MDVRGLVASLSRMMEEGRLQEAEACCQEVLGNSEAPDGARVLTLQALVRLYRVTDRLPEAEQACRQELEILEKMYGKNHSHTAPALHNLSMILGRLNKHEEAVAVSNQELDIVTANSPVNSTPVADALVTLAEHHYELGHSDVAELLVQRALDIYEGAEGRHSFGVSTCLNNLGRIYENREQNETGVRYLEEASQIREDLLGVHPDTAFTLLNYGTGLAALGRYADADAVLARCEQMYRDLGMQDTPYAGACRENRAICARGAGSEK